MILTTVGKNELLTSNGFTNQGDAGTSRVFRLPVTLHNLPYKSKHLAKSEINTLPAA